MKPDSTGFCTASVRLFSKVLPEDKVFYQQIAEHIETERHTVCQHLAPSSPLPSTPDPPHCAEMR